MDSRSHWLDTSILSKNNVVAVGSTMVNASVVHVKFSNRAYMRIFN